MYNTRHFVQIHHKRQSDFQEIKTDAQKPHKALQALHLTKFADFKLVQKEKIPKTTPHSLLLHLYCAYPFWGQRATLSVFLLFEEKLQCWVPLISWKAIRQLTVIQRLGNFAQKEKNKYITLVVQQKYPFLFKCVKNMTFTKISPTCGEMIYSILCIRETYLLALICCLILSHLQHSPRRVNKEH